MQSPQEPRPRARSPFLAAVLSLVFPGLGHAYAGAYERALGFAAPLVLVGALVAGVVLRIPKAELAGVALQAWFLSGLFIVNLVLFAYRAAAVVDAWRVTRHLNAAAASGDRRIGRVRMPLQPLPVAGVVAVLVVLSFAHVAVGRYDVLASSTIDCVFGGTCGDATPAGPAGSPAGAGPSGAPAASLPPEGSAAPSVAAPPWNGTDRLNILLLGVDQRPNEGTFNTDTMIVVSIDPATSRVAMFSLPRDMVDIPVPPGPARAVFGSVFQGKINSWFTAVSNRGDIYPGTAATRGYAGLKAILGNLYNLDIKYYVEVNFQGFVQAVDALGGVTINVQIPVMDDAYPTDDGNLERVYIPAGVQHMTGAQALVYARSRHGKNGFGSNDFDRAARQQRVLVSIRQQTDIASLLPRIDSLAAALKNAVRTDIPREILPQLIGLAERVDTKNIRSYVFAPPLYGQELFGTPRGYIIEPAVGRIRAAVAEAFIVDPGQEAIRERIAAEAATVWVLNGTGQSGQASVIASYLSYLGMEASAPNQRPPTASRTTTIVAYNGAATSMPETLAALKSAFGVPVTTKTDPSALADFVVTTGTSTPDLTPPPGP